MVEARDFYQQWKRVDLGGRLQVCNVQINERAWAFFDAQPAGYCHAATWYVVSAKREETRAKRLEMLVDYSARGKRLPMLTPPQRR